MVQRTQQIGNDIMDRIIVINENLQIAEAELSFKFVPSGGPGGQHANKAATRAILTFDITNSASLSEKQRQRLLSKLANRLDSEGRLKLSAQSSRSQHQNREEAIGRLQQVIAAALHIPKRRKKSHPSRAVKEERLREKRERSQKKSSRRWRPE